MRKSFSRIGTLTVRNIKEIARDPLSLIFIFAMPLAMQILFYFTFHKMTPQFEMKYLAPGIVLFSQAFLTLFMGLLIALDRTTSFLTRLYVSEAKAYEFILSYALSALPIVFIQSVLFFLVGGIIDPKIFGAGMLLALLLSLFTSLTFLGLGILFGCLCNEKSIGGVASIVIAGQSLLSGMWFPMEGIPKGVLTLMNVLPFRNATTLVQNALNGAPASFKAFGLPILVVAAYALGFLTLSIFVFRNKMKAK